jgi:hypothetical protein
MSQPSLHLPAPQRIFQRLQISETLIVLRILIQHSHIVFQPKNKRNQFNFRTHAHQSGQTLHRGGLHQVQILRQHWEALKKDPFLLAKLANSCVVLLVRLEMALDHCRLDLSELGQRLELRECGVSNTWNPRSDGYLLLYPSPGFAGLLHGWESAVEDEAVDVGAWRRTIGRSQIDEGRLQRCCDLVPNAFFRIIGDLTGKLGLKKEGSLLQCGCISVGSIRCYELLRDYFGGETPT